uniref:SET domain-containing protein n=1 Tax=Helicotheca tamesis TaxID=374047 RepID=A0A7S2MYR8_9STRA|mmetsp:Transcript_5985/g.8199  ORF Transcript_5985/g.8199 Transcript_5985/m.8199 type:complete len:488 (+) Transcript_5985:3-1466(+)
MGLNNVENSITKYDSGGLHRSTYPGAGAITYYHDLQTRAVSDIPSGSEVFSSYGEQWFTSRIGTFGKIPLELDYTMADHVIQAMKVYMDEHGHKTTSAAQKHAMELVRNILDLDATSNVLKLLPEKLDEVNRAAEVGSGRYNLPESVRSPEWLEANAHCVDNIQAGPSTNPAAGRGAFATRHINKGATVSVSPLLLFHKKHFVMKSNDGPDSYQLAMNYCFGNDKSTMLLFPYGPIVNLINHDSKAPNAKIQWFEKNSGDTDKFLRSKFTPDLDESKKVDFKIEYIALRDIQPGEEIFIDYGKEWEKAWKAHIEHWKPLSNAKDYVSPSTFISLNSDDKPVLTEQEQEKTPYPDNIVTACYYVYYSYDYIGSHHENDDGTITVEDMWEENEVVFTFHQYLRPCGILSREVTSDGATIYSAEIFNVPDTISDPDSVIPDTEHRVVHGIPRRAITFVEIPYTGDQHLRSAFRHPIGIPDSMFPPLWRNA